MFSVKGHEEEEEEEEEVEEAKEEEEEEEYNRKEKNSISNINDHKITPYGNGLENSFDTYAVERKIPVSHQVLFYTCIFIYIVVSFHRQMSGGVKRSLQSSYINIARASWKSISHRVFRLFH